MTWLSSTSAIRGSRSRLFRPNVTASGGVYTASFEVSQTVPLTYVVADRNAWQSPASITRYAPAVDLHDPANGADYIIITHHDFITGAQTLADDRAAQGLRTMVVDVDDVYDQFTDGIFNPIAIKAFLKYAYFNWQAPAPAYVLLVGDGHWNFKNLQRSPIMSCTGLHADLHAAQSGLGRSVAGRSG